MSANKPGFAGITDDYSWAQLFNPAAAFTGGRIRYPKFMYDLMPNNPEAAAIISNIGASALLAAGLVGAYRGIKHLYNINNDADTDNPAADEGKLTKQISTTVETPFSATKEASAESYEPGRVNNRTFTTANFLSAALPIGATLLAAGLTYKAVDDWAVARRNKILDEAITGKQNVTKQLMHTRARIAKGTATDAEVDAALQAVGDEDAYVKTAALEKEAFGGLMQKGWAAAGLLALGLSAATAAGVYKYMEASDRNNIRYKAIKKGLKEYVKTRAALTPVAIVPTDGKGYFASIDAGAKQPDIRDEVEVNPEDMNKPISVSI